MLSLVVIAAVLGGTFYLVGQGMQTGEISRNRERMAMIAENQIERLKIVAQDDGRVFRVGEEFCITEQWSYLTNKTEFNVQKNGAGIVTHADPADNLRDKNLRKFNECYGIEGDNIANNTSVDDCECDIAITKTAGPDDSGFIPGTDTDVFEVKVSWHSLRKNADSLTMYHRVHRVATLNDQIVLYPFYESKQRRVRLSFNDPRQAITQYEGHYKWDTASTMTCDSSIDTDLDANVWDKSNNSALIERGAPNYVNLSDFANHGDIGWLCIRVTNNTTKGKGYRKLRLQYHATHITFRSPNNNTTISIPTKGVSNLQYFKVAHGNPGPDCEKGKPPPAGVSWSAITGANKVISNLNNGDWVCIRGRNTASPPEWVYSGLIYFGAIIDTSQTGKTVEAEINTDYALSTPATAHPYYNVREHPWAHSDSTVDKEADCSSTTYTVLNANKDKKAVFSGLGSADVNKYVCFRLQKPGTQGYIYGAIKVEKQWISVEIHFYRRYYVTTQWGQITCGTGGPWEAPCGRVYAPKVTGISYTINVANAKFQYNWGTCSTSNRSLKTPPQSSGQKRHAGAKFLVCVQYKKTGETRKNVTIKCENTHVDQGASSKSWSKSIDIYDGKTDYSC